MIHRIIKLNVFCFGLFLLFITGPLFATTAPIKKILYVYGTDQNPIENSENFERMYNTLEGVGIPFETENFDLLATKDLTPFQLIIVAWSNDTYWNDPVPQTVQQKFLEAINQGINILWIGPGLWGYYPPSNQLAQAFGLTYNNSYGRYGINKGEFVDLTGSTARFSVKDEFITRVTLNGASVEGNYYIDNNVQPDPFITSYQGSGKGKTVFISMNIMDWWKENEAEDTYARTEVLIKYIRKLTNQGYVAKHSVKNGKEAPFLLRLEDYTPGGDMMLGNPLETWVDRLDNLIYFLKNTGLKLNMAIIPRFAHPCLGESHSWSDADQGIPLLKRYAQTVLAEGGSLIAHGYKHQVGIGQEDFSGGDYEMCLSPTDQVLCDTRANTCGNNFRSLGNQRAASFFFGIEFLLPFSRFPLSFLF